MKQMNLYHKAPCLVLPHERDEYPPGFFRWLDTTEGFRIWQEFEERALQMALKRKHYSGQSIIEVIRWHTSLKDGTEFKINNNWIAGLSRLWLHNYGHVYPNFFRIRDTLGRNK